MSPLLVLFDLLNGEAPGIGAISSIKKPIPTTDISENVTLVTQWIKDKTQLIVRWPKQHTSVFNLTEYVIGQAVDCEFRAALALQISDNKDHLSNLRSQLVKAKSKEQPTATKSSASASTIVRQLFPDNNGTADKEASSAMVHTIHTSVGRKNKRDAASNEDYLKEIESLRHKARKLEDDLTESAKNFAKKEDKCMDLADELNMLRSYFEAPKDLAEKMQENLDKLKVLWQHEIISPKPLVSNPLMPVTPSTSPMSPASKKMVPLDGDIMMDYNALRDACSHGRDGNSKASLNAMIGCIINYFMTPEEQSQHSLSGRACRSIPNSKPKKPFPVHLIDAITNFILPRWEDWHKSKQSVDAIRNAISATLTNGHSKTKKKASANRHTEEDVDANLLPQIRAHRV